MGGISERFLDKYSLTDYQLRSGFELAFWSVLGLSAIIGLGIMMLQGLSLVRIGKVAVGVELGFVAMIFLILSVFSYLMMALARVDNEEIYRPVLTIGNDSGQEMGFIFYLGFISWYSLLSFKSAGFFGSIVQTMPNPPTISILSTAAASGLTQAQNYFVNGLMAPWVEESFFLMALPLALLAAWKPFQIQSNLVRYLLIVLVPSFIFASFHVKDPVFSGFWLAAFFFRTILQGLIYADVEFDALTGIALLGSFIVGAHISNNIFMLGGVVNYFQVVSGDVGLLILSLVPFLVYGLWTLQFFDNIRTS